MLNNLQLELTHPVRCYDGVFDSKSQLVFQNQQLVMEAIQKKEPEARATYFPVEQQWVVHVWGRELSDYHNTKGQALRDAYEKLHR